MNVTHNGTKKLITAALGVATAAMVAPAVMSDDAGAANAKTPATWVEFEPFTAGGDLTVVIHNNTPTDLGQCRYVASRYPHTPQPPFTRGRHHNELCMSGNY